MRRAELLAGVFSLRGYEVTESATPKGHRCWIVRRPGEEIAEGTVIDVPSWRRCVLWRPFAACLDTRTIVDDFTRFLEEGIRPMGEVVSVASLGEPGALS